MVFQLEIISNRATCGVGKGRGTLIFFAYKERAYFDPFLCHRFCKKLIIGISFFCNRKADFIAVAEEKAFALGKDFFFEDGVTGQKRIKGCQRLGAVAVIAFVPEAAPLKDMFFALCAVSACFCRLTDFFL